MKNDGLVSVCWTTAILALVLAAVTQSVVLLAAGSVAGLLGSLASMVKG